MNNNGNEIEEKLKTNAARLSILSNSGLILLKIVAGITTSSFSIISEAIHSMSDLLASIIAYFAVKKASEPADKDHAFGHGKYEDFSGLIEGVLIILAAFYIVYESSLKIIHGKFPEISVDAAIYVMMFSVVVNCCVSSHIFKTAKQTGSVALFADAEHLRTDIYTSIGVLTGLVLIKITDFHIIDPIIALFVSVLIFEAGWSICKKTIDNLLDKSLSIEAENKITEIIKSVSGYSFLISNIKTRQSGAKTQIELTLSVDGDMTVKESHCLCNVIEEELNTKIGNIDTLIHIEPNQIYQSVK